MGIRTYSYSREVYKTNWEYLTYQFLVNAKAAHFTNIMRKRVERGLSRADVV